MRQRTGVGVAIVGIALLALLAVDELRPIAPAIIFAAVLFMLAGAVVIAASPARGAGEHRTDRRP